MQLLKQKILDEGIVIKDKVLKVDSFLNHQIDVKLFNEMGKYFYQLFGNKNITKILTIEASGIGIACIAAQYFDVPVVYAKKTQADNMDAVMYESTVYSFTKGMEYKVRVAKQYLHKDERVLIIDDFLASGTAVLGLKDIVDQAGAELVGVGIAIEKEFQGGGKILKDRGIEVKSLAVIRSMEDGKITFAT